MDAELKNNLTAGHKWLRLLFMIFFLIISYFVKLLVIVIAIFQFLMSIISGKPNPRLLAFGQSLSKFVYQIVSYLTYSTEEKPFPFTEWPTEGSTKTAVRKAKPKAAAKKTDK